MLSGEGDLRENRMQAALKVLLADDHPLILQGLRRSLEACDDIDVVGEAHTGAEVLPLVERRSPDVVVLDLRMPGVRGAECVRDIARRHPEVKTVVLSACEDRASIDSAVSAGASAYVLKSVSAVDIPSVVRQVAAGYTLFHSPREDGPAAGSARDEAPELTDRETTILAAVASGMTTKAISRELWVTQHTVKFHLTNIYRKLGVSNRSGAVRFAYEHGLIAREG
jgi:DNA-binding NarL/FixJ family response regulator